MIFPHETFIKTSFQSYFSAILRIKKFNEIFIKKEKKVMMFLSFFNRHKKKKSILKNLVFKIMIGTFCATCTATGYPCSL